MLREKAMQARIGPVQARRARPQSALPHEAFHAPSTQAIPLSLQGPMNPWTSISATALLEQSTNLFQPDPVLCPACTLAALLPRVVPRSRDTIERTQPFHWERSSLAPNEGEDVRFRAEQNRMAFFRSSCSCCSNACARSSACKRLSSRTFGGLTGASPSGPRRLPSRISLRHRDSMKG